MYIYHLPYQERLQLCFVLDHQNKWEELALQMKFEAWDTDKIRRCSILGKSPSDELLNMWANFNHTVLELFILLSRMKMYSAMKILEKFVDKRYHILIADKEDNLVVDIRNVTRTRGTTLENLNRSEKIANDKNAEFSHSDNNVGSPVPVPESIISTPQILYKDLQQSTNNWDTDVLLGKGGFGKVYKGTWKCTKVAIKRLEVKGKLEQVKQTFKELYCLNCFRHDNILPLYGYSMDGEHPCLVYQFMSGGSLDNRLRSDPHIVPSWPTRLKIAIGTARGLQFLHSSLYSGKPLIHGDIKTANILLDPSDQPKIGDFGLARDGPQGAHTHVIVSKVCGTKPYLPPEYLRSYKLSTKVDTYSFGIVLFELATGLRAGDKNELLKDKVKNFPGDILNLKDNRATGEGDKYFEGLIKVGKKCVEHVAKNRPEMVQVLLFLEEIGQ